jgi:hypothetical protein
MKITHRVRAVGCALLVITTVGAALLAARPASADPVAPASVDFGDVPLGTAPADRPIAVVIPDGYHLGGAFASSSGQLSVDNGDCVSGATHSCAAHVHLDPRTVGSVTGSWAFDLCSDGSDPCQPGINVPLRANVVSVFAATPGEINFGSIPIYTYADRTLSLTLDAGYGWRGTTITDGQDYTSIQGGTCSANSVGSCTVTLRMRGPSFGTQNTYVTLRECRSDEASLCRSIVVHGSGGVVSQAYAEPSSVSFGDVAIGTAVTQNVTISFDQGFLGGGAGVRLPGAPFTGSAGTCASASSGSCTMTVSYTPVYPSESSSSFDVPECDPAHPDVCSTVRVFLHGTGTSVRSVDPASVDFGNVPVGTTVQREITVNPDVGYGVELSKFDGDPGFGYDNGTCDFGERPCTVKVSFHATAFGPATTTMTLASCHNGDCLPIDVPLRATGSSVFAATPNPIDFGDVLIGASATQPVDLVLDAGYHPDTVTTIGSDNSPDSSVLIGTCLTDNTTGSCSMQVGATSTAAGQQSATLRLEECNAQAACRTIDAPIRINGVTPLTVPAQTLPDGTVGVAYHARLHADGGKSELTWTVGGGQLPAGLSLDAQGVISGTPTAAGTSTFTAHVVDGSSLHQAGDVSLTLAVSAAPVTPSNPPSSSPPSHAGSSHPASPSHPGSPSAPGSPGSPAAPQSPDSPSHGSGDGLAFTGLLADPVRIAGLAALLLGAGLALLAVSRRRAGRR